MTQEPEHKGKVVTVCSAKGGIGRTLVSANLAIALNKKNINISLLDADFQFGDISTVLDLKPTFTVKDVVEEISSIDSNSIHNYLTKHASGIKVLPAPDKPEYADLISSEAIKHIVDMMAVTSDYLVIDNSVGIQEESLELLERSDVILLVTTPEMAALRNTKLMLETLEKIGLVDKTKLLVNRYDMDSLIKVEDIPGILDQDEAHFIPNNFKLASQSLNIGIPFTISQSKSNLSKSFYKLAETLIDNQTMSVKKRKGSIVSKLFVSNK
ncbi:AAA family ATPase [Ornithinibacillus californiensis]|uniref:AAA family ATPase n=1 Tax=Ornithinibacillus californiensis TaxID=161536 RepID=UPI00064DCA2A|nr:P-loop NTPase [Ornithinibacillus californiensis]